MILTDELAQQYQDLWDTMVIQTEHIPEIIDAAKKILKYKKQFELAVLNTSIPYYFVAIVYYKEEGCNFKGHIHNGDSLKKRTVNIPAGRPIVNPKNGFPSGYTFIESAIDWIELKGYKNVLKWDMPNLLYHFEANNGFGYRNLHTPINSPYLWSYTNHYEKGLFVSDGKYDAEKINQDMGCAPLLRYLTDATLGIVPKVFTSPNVEI